MNRREWKKSRLSEQQIRKRKISSGTPADIGACVGFIRDIDAVLSELKKRDIYVIGRIACFKDPILAEAVPELALLSDDGRPVTDKEGLAWVNPCNEDTWEYMIELAEYGADLFGTVIGNEIDVTMVGQDYAALSDSAEGLSDVPDSDRAVVRAWLRAF